MRRRDFITALGSAAAAWPLAARAQQVKRLGVLYSTSESETEFAPAAVFREALGKLGWIEGRTVQIDLRFGNGDPARLRAYAEELVRHAPDVIFAGGNVAARAVQQQTQSIPIVFVGAGAVGEGNTTVRNIAHPEGNITGFANKDEAIEGKWLELLKEASPVVERVAFIYFDVQNPVVAARQRETVATAARRLGVTVTSVPFRESMALERAIETLAVAPNGGLIINSNVITHRDLILRTAAQHRLPLISAWKFYTAAGGLMSYGADLANIHREAATYVDRILRGAKPGDLPVQLPTKYDLAINLGTAKALGLRMSPALLARADEVIE